MILHADSHLDHVKDRPDVVELVLERFADRSSFFMETFELEDGRLPCGLYGPIMGDPPISDKEVKMVSRGNRPYPSRICAGIVRWSRKCTVIAGPHQGYPCVLYTVFGGPITPKEPNDPTLKPEEREESERFWAVHALSMEAI